VTALTVADLDSLAESEGVEDYPKSGTKAKKLEALEAAGVDLPEDDAGSSDKTFTTRHAANIAFFKLPAEKRADVKVGRDPKSGLFSIVARGK
jgi:hypothetical protein